MDLMAADVRNLKIAVRINLVFDADPADLEPAAAVLNRVNAHAKVQLSPGDLQKHLVALKGRLAGDSLLARAEEKHVDVRMLRMTRPYVREFGLCVCECDGAVLSVDVFNADDELGLGSECGRNVVEIFRVDGRDVNPLINVARDVFEASDATVAYGGVSFYAESFLGLHKRARMAGSIVVPQDLLWPVMILPLGLSQEPPRLKVHRVVRGQRGLLVQAFEDLWTGNEEEYVEAARSLGLRSFWGGSTSAAETDNS